MECKMTCEVEIKGEGEIVAAVAKEEETAAAATTKATDAKDYLEQHHVLQFVQACLQTVIKERPDNPYEAMAMHFTSGYHPTDIRTPQKKVEAPEVREPS